MFVYFCFPGFESLFRATNLDKLTIMVNNLNLSRYMASEPPSDAKGVRTITGGPIYNHDEVLSIINGFENAQDSFRLWTKKCQSDVRNLSFDFEDIEELLRQVLAKGVYKSSEWCQQNENGNWAACDAYALQRYEWNVHAHKELLVEYYLKFAIAKSGKILLVVSCHI